MFNRFTGLLRAYIGLRLLALIGCIILSIIITYQLIITLFIPCFYNVILALILYLIFLTLLCWTIFGY